MLGNTSFAFGLRVVDNHCRTIDAIERGLNCCWYPSGLYIVKQIRAGFIAKVMPLAVSRDLTHGAVMRWRKFARTCAKITHIAWIIVTRCLPTRAKSQMRTH
jgi:hypothetical protein